MTADLRSCDQLLRERARIAAVLADLPASWGQVRKVLNELPSDRRSARLLQGDRRSRTSSCARVYAPTADHVREMFAIGHRGYGLAVGDEGIVASAS